MLMLELYNFSNASLPLAQYSQSNTVFKDIKKKIIIYICTVFKSLKR